jgi:hypothetical protein
VLKRTFWTAVGYGAGIGSSIYVQKRVRRTVERYTPEHVRDQASLSGQRALAGAKQVGRTVAEAVREGRSTMVETEAELQREFPQPVAPGSGARRVSVRRASIRT